MFKYIALFTAMLCLVNSQRPWHAGSSNRLPMVLPQYIDERIAAEQASQVAEVGQTGVQPGQAVQPDQAIQPDQVVQPGQTVQSNIGVQPVQAFQPGQAIQPVQAFQPGQAIQPVQEVQVTQGASAFASADVGLSSRINASGVNNVVTAQPTTVLGTTFATTTINPADLPVDAHGDVDLVNRIKTWPREKQPFWYINWQAIQAHRGDVNNSAQVAQVQPNLRSFFAG